MPPRGFLRKHLTGVERFYRQLERTDYQSEAALKCKERFVRNRDKLFTFLNYDGVPWNNNNAEHAIKAFARLRDVIAGSYSKKGVDEYLTLLTVAETCEYQGLDFLDFLRSREMDVETYSRRRGRPPKKEIERKESSVVESDLPVSDKLVDLPGDAVAKRVCEDFRATSLVGPRSLFAPLINRICSNAAMHTRFPRWVKPGYPAPRLLDSAASR